MLFRKIGIRSGMPFSKIGIRNGYVFEASMARPRPKSLQVDRHSSSVNGGCGCLTPLFCVFNMKIYKNEMT